MCRCPKRQHAFSKWVRSEEAARRNGGPRNKSQEPEGPRRLSQEEGHLSWQDGGPETGVGGDGRRPEEAVAG